MLRFKEYHFDEIPMCPGIYAFQFAPISLGKVGLKGNSGFADNELKQAKSRLLKRLKKMDTILSGREYVGTINEKGKFNQNKKTIRIEAMQEPAFTNEGLSKKIDDIDDIVSLVRLIEIISNALPPLYCGVAINQTLKQRFEQHRADYSSKKENSLGGRLAANNIDWDDLLYQAIEIPTGLISEKTIMLCEDLAQGLSKPIYSYR